MRYLLTAFIVLLGIYSSAQCWQKISSRYDHVLAIHADGTLWNWGGALNPQRPLTTPTLLDTGNWKEIATGNSYQLAIKTDGTMWAWGYNSYGQLGLGTTTNVWTMTQVGTDTDWDQVVCGRDHTIAIKTDGTLWIWGRNNYGQLGTGTDRTNSSMPTQLGSATNWEEISGGEWHTLVRNANNDLFFVGACYGTQFSQLNMVGSSGIWKTMGAGVYSDYSIRTDGTLWTWGQNNGNYSNMTQVGSISNWEKVSMSHETHVLLINASNELWALGYNQYGQLGDGTTNYASLPVLVDNAGDWSQVVAGNHYSLALQSDQSFWAWGMNDHAQFGNGLNKNTLQPIDETGPWKMATSTPASYNGHTIAIKEDGTIWGWGDNGSSQLGIYNSTDYALPQQIGTDTTWATTSNGFHFTLAIKEDGTLWAWGRNQRGQLGLGSTAGTKTSPTKVGLDTTWWKVACGSEFALALKTDSTLWAWGYNYNGQIGNGVSGSSAPTVFTPIQIGVGSTWTDIAAGSSHSIAIKGDSTIWSWGYNSYGQLGRSGITNVPNQAGTEKWIEIAAGGFHTLAIREDSTLSACGRNLYGQLGTGLSSNSPVFIPVVSSKKWVDIEGGYEHSIAIDKDDSLWGWGRNAVGQISDSSTYSSYFESDVPIKIDTLTTYKGIGAGPVNSIAIKIDGTLQTTGDSFVPDYGSNFTQLGYLQLTPALWNSCNYCPATSYSYTETICFGDSIYFGGNYKNSSGTYHDTLINSNGCDSLLTLNLTVGTEITGTESVVICDSFTWINGITYYNSTVQPNHILSSTTGCDSTVSLDLTILQPSSSIDTLLACDSLTWIDGITYYSSNSSATHIETNAVGCDSIIHLNLTIFNATNGIDVISACDSFTWINGITYFNSTNSETFIIPNSNGCDSTVLLDLTITSPNVSVTINDPELIAMATGVNFQWLDCSNNTIISGANSASYLATANGDYAVIIDDAGCIDTSACYTISTVGLESIESESGILLYPNPSKNGHFEIILSATIEKVEVWDLAGRKVEISLHKDNSLVDASNLASGRYIIHTTDIHGFDYIAPIEIIR